MRHSKSSRAHADEHGGQLGPQRCCRVQPKSALSPASSAWHEVSLNIFSTIGASWVAASFASALPRRQGLTARCATPRLPAYPPRHGKDFASASIRSKHARKRSRRASVGELASSTKPLRLSQATDACHSNCRSQYLMPISNIPGVPFCFAFAEKPTSSPREKFVVFLVSPQQSQQRT